MSTFRDIDLMRGFRLGDWVVEPLRERILHKGQAHHLEPKVMQVLVMLACHAQTPVTRDALLETVWADTVVGEEVLSRAISILRNVLGDERTDPTFIRTLPRVGYELVADVQLEPESGSPKISSYRPYYFIAAGVLVLTLLFYWSVLPKIENNIVVMLPVSAANAELGGYANELSDALHGLMATAPGLKVIARTWSFAVRDPGLPPQGIGAQFGAGYILSGLVGQADGRYQLSLELVDTNNGSSAWQQRFYADSTGELTPLALDEVRKALNKRMQAGINAIPNVSRPVNEEAYRVYLQARHHWSLRGAQHIDRAASLLQRSVELAPQFADAKLAQAQVAAIEPFYTDKPIAAQFDYARKHLADATRLNAELKPQALALEGFMLLRSRDWSGAEKALLQATSAAEPYPLAHYWASMFYAALGDYSRSREQARLAVELAPATPVFRDRLAVTHLWMNDESAAGEEFERAEELGFALDFRSKAYLLYLKRTHQYDSLDTVLRSMKLPGTWVSAFVRGLHDPDAKTEAIEATKSAIEADRLPRELHFGIWVFLGEARRAIEAFDYDFRSPDIELLWAPECDMLRIEPQYASMLARLGLPDL